jgi:hypothetical protein
MPIQILEHISWNTAIAGGSIEDDVSVKLIQNGLPMDKISLSPRDKALARDRGTHMTMEWTVMHKSPDLCEEPLQKKVVKSNHVLTNAL